ncbi:hypothetical protein F511_06627 [Dorcoceras hygrometricum]|uniref:Uncharacterized protein n=1 Tax=Dorcoceras hygrometricum TaxID=472368 RepID=A0A2Z7AN01_9LAMI|nr:hypothetical protein F511_06627 [Dorcoceras hygrometricum]
MGKAALLKAMKECPEEGSSGASTSQALPILGLKDAGIDQLNFHSVQLDYLELLQMGNTDPNKTKVGNKYEVKPQYEELSKQLGGRHSNPVVTTPTIALDFSDTIQQSASHNVTPNQLGGRHSNPVVTTPTIALDFSDTTQQSASHNVGPNQIPNKDTSSNNSSLLPLKLPRQLPLKIPRSLNLPKIPNILAQTNERKLTQRIETHGATYCSIQPFRVPAPAQHSFQKLVGKDRSSQEVSNATKNSKNGGRNQREISIENDGEQ